MAFDFDLFVIGAGSGGVRASRVAAGFGAGVAIAEHYRVGGTCVIRGCVPKKLLVYASHFAESFEDAAGFGWTLEGARFSWPSLIEAKNREISRLEAVYERLLEDSGVRLLRGRARILDAHTVLCEDRTVSAANILVATGGWPHLPAIPGVDLCITSNEAFELPELPRRILLVGGGYIAVEFAGIFSGLGSEVTVSYRGEQILRGFDRDVRRHLAQEMSKKGIRILLRNDVAGVMRIPAGSLLADTAGPQGPLELECDAVMYCTGRWPCTQGLGLERAGVLLDSDGGVIVDAHGRSSVPSIFAAGDVTNRIALTPVAIREGQAIATTLFGGGEAVPCDHDFVPTAVFSRPPVGTTGLTEGEAIEACGEIEIYQTEFRPLMHTLSGRDERTLMKLIVQRSTQRVVGAHMVGGDAPEIIQGIGIAVKAGLTKRQFDATVGIHPTAAEEFVTLREKRVVSRTERG
ncbi:MAG: glutathione-disulfide reductase [Betaproteobacteria bacterium RIFCSPLOWO2_02_FULL_65_24]|nr:MAG: glutathione-disulfide reductase [Betaproteobacteria bacterium RIFCSPLOWO2_02_FULL_65_24]